MTLDNDFDKYPVSAEYAAGLHSFLSLTNLSPLAVKGQITGPVTWGLSVADDSRRAIIYDDVLGDAVAKLLRLKASWQEKALSQISKNTIIFIDEPYMAAFGSVGVSLSKERIISRAEKEARADDEDMEIIERRMNTFLEKTVPVIDRYRKAGKLKEVDGGGSIEQVYAGLKSVLGLI